MRVFLSETIFFLRGKTKHPIYRREAAGWSYVRPWRSLRRGCLPLMGLSMLSMTCCCGLALLPRAFENSDSPLTSLLLMAPGILWFGIFAGGEIINGLTGLVATVLTATAISAEVEADTYALLRLTPIPPRQIVLAKLGAAFAQLRLPVITVMVSRFVSIVSGILLLIFYVIVLSSDPAASSAGSPTTPSLFPPAISTDVWAPLISLLSGILSWLIVGAIWLIYYAVAKPFLDILLFLSVGLVASSLARTRAGGLFTAGALRLGLGVISYIGSQIISSFFSFFSMPLMILAVGMPSFFDDLMNSQPGLLMIGGAIISVALVFVITVVELGVALILLNITQDRAERLPFTTS